MGGNGFHSRNRTNCQIRKIKTTMSKPLIIYVEGYTSKPAELAPKTQLTIENPNWEFILDQCPTHLKIESVQRDHKKRKMSPVLIVEPMMSGMERLEFDTSIRPHESDGSEIIFDFTTEKGDGIR